MSANENGDRPVAEEGEAGSVTQASTAHTHPMVPGWFRREWPTVKKAPVSFTIAVIGVSACFGFAVYVFYAKGILEQKQAVIEQKQATIDRKENDIQSLENRLKQSQESAGDSIKTTLTYDSNPNDEHIRPSRTNEPAICYPKTTGALYQWDVKSQEWK